MKNQKLKRKRLIAQILIKQGSISAGNNNKLIPKQLMKLIANLKKMKFD